MEKLALTISQAAALGGPCRSALYVDIREGRLRAVKRGRSTRILVDDFKKYLASLPSVRPVLRAEELTDGAGEVAVIGRQSSRS